MRTETILGFPVAAEEPGACLATMSTWSRERCKRPRWFACANPHSLVVARSSEPFRAALTAADVLVPDGAGIVLASRLLGGAIRQRVTGMDVFLAVCEAMEKAGGGRMFFLGATDDTLARIAARIPAAYPRIKVAGVLSPPFAPEFTEREDEAMLAAIRAARPDVLWVGMTAPKQEIWVHRHLHELPVALVGPIGAAFDFFAGTRERSPQWALDHGLEWLPRLVRDPRRLWRRTLISAPIFLALVVGQRLRSGPARLAPGQRP